MMQQQQRIFNFFHKASEDEYNAQLTEESRRLGVEIAEHRQREERKETLRRLSRLEAERSKRPVGRPKKRVLPAAAETNAASQPVSSVIGNINGNNNIVSVYLNSNIEGNIQPAASSSSGSSSIQGHSSSNSKKSKLNRKGNKYKDWFEDYTL
jgi:hypothetical protein